MSRRSTTLQLAAASALSMSFAASCQNSDGPRPSTREPFIALERDFQGYEGWAQIALGARPAPAHDAHDAHDAREYINRPPPAGAGTFPVGSILVKTTATAHAAANGGAGAEAAAGGQVFAMVKRGAGYNAQGAPGWEWFELRRRADRSLGIVWRGINPPDGEGYGGAVTGGCNGCHERARTNDYVHSLSLAKR